MPNQTMESPTNDAFNLEPLTISPRREEFRDPMAFLSSLYTNSDYKIEERGAILVDVPSRFRHKEAPEIDQSFKLSWLVRQNLQQQSEPGVWYYTESEKLAGTLNVRKFLAKVDIDERCDMSTYWRDCEKRHTWDACFLDPPFFKNDDPTFRNLPEWHFSSVNDMMEESNWGPRQRAFFIGNAGSVSMLTVEYAHLGMLHYLHWGAPRLWTIIPAKYFRTLQNCIGRTFPQLFQICPTLHNVTALYEPSFLERQRIPYVQYEQKAGQLMVVAYQAQHQAINLGVNVAECTNYATPHWLPYSSHQAQCHCPDLKKKPETGNEMRELAFRKYMSDVDPKTVPDPTDNGKWYCARKALPKAFRGIHYLRTASAFFGLDDNSKASDLDVSANTTSNTNNEISSTMGTEAEHSG